jgi:hypothetical protein
MRTKGALNKKHDRVKIKCPTCGLEFETYKSKVDDDYLHYCSRKCSDGNRKNVWKVFGNKTSNYKDGKSSYRELAIRHYGNKCIECGYDGNKFPKLIWVHHKDFVPRTKERNNGLENLEVLCVRCHMEKHLSQGDDNVTI